MTPRIRFASIASLVLIPAASASAQLTTSITTGSLAIGLDPVTNVGGPPLDLTHAGDGTDRLFMAGQTTGDVRIFKNNALVSTPFLDINGSGVTGAGLTLFSGSECGLLGMAFHPNFAVPGAPGFGKFYTYTSEPKGGSIAGVDFIHDELDGTVAVPANGGNHDSVIREWTVSAGNPDQISMAAADRREILRIRQPQSNHNGGCLKFGPDGMLYIALGDGGGGNDDGGAEPDGHTEATATVRGNAQDVQDYTLARNNNVLGKILRIDPRDPAGTPASIGAVGANGKYRIPASNARVGLSGADEVFAFGLRNPFRMSFDRLNGGLYVGDVGQDFREEVDIVTNGGNYGWVYWEGTRVNFAEPTGLPDIKPIGEYTHGDGQATIGGFVYRGENIPELYGKYVFGELGWDDPGTPETTNVGRVFYMDASGGTISQFQYLLNAPSAQLYAFGEDRDGELYAMFANGDVRRILGRQWYATTGGSWGTAGNWLGATPGGVGTAANFLGRVSSTGSVPAVINLDGNRTVGSMLFNNNVTNAQGISYRIAPGTGGTLTLDNGASVATLKVIKGNQEITAPVAIASSATLDIDAAGSLNVTGDLTIAASRTLTKTGAGSATLRPVTMQPNSALTVAAGILTVRSISGGTVNVDAARLNIAPNGGAVGTSKVGALNITSNGTLNIGNNKFVVTSGNIGTPSGGTYSGLSGLIQRGYNFGAWDGDGIVTNFAAAQAGLTTIAIATANQTGFAGGIFSGVSVAGSDILMMYTYAGDANLDGTIDGGDYGIIDNFVQVPGASGYANGDFNYDGVIDGGDYGIIDNNNQAQGAPFSTSGASSDVTAVPEPSSAGVMVVAAATALARRTTRRRRQSAVTRASRPCVYRQHGQDARVTGERIIVL